MENLVGRTQRPHDELAGRPCATLATREGDRSGAPAATHEGGRLVRVAAAGKADTTEPTRRARRGPGRLAGAA